MPDTDYRKDSGIFYPAFLDDPSMQEQTMRTSKVLFISVVFSGLAVSASSVLASDAGKPVPQEVATNPALPLAETTASSDNDRIVCTRERSIGSNRVQKICRKASEIATLRGDTQDAVRNNTRPTGQFFEKN